MIGETLVRATAEDAGPVTPARIAAPAAPADYGDLVRDPLASWIETAFGLDRDDEGKLARRAPTTVQRAAPRPGGARPAWEDQCEKAIQRTLQAGRGPGTRRSGRPLFAFRLHQFLSKGDTVYVTLEDQNTRHITRGYQVEQPGSGGKVLLPLAFCRECGQEYLVGLAQERSGMVTYLARRDATIAATTEGDAPPSSDGTCTSPPTCHGRVTGETVFADRRVPDPSLQPCTRPRGGTPGSGRPPASASPVAVTVDTFGRKARRATPARGHDHPGEIHGSACAVASRVAPPGSDFAKLATLEPRRPVEQPPR